MHKSGWTSEVHLQHVSALTESLNYELDTSEWHESLPLVNVTAINIKNPVEITNQFILKSNCNANCSELIK